VAVAGALAGTALAAIGTAGAAPAPSQVRTQHADTLVIYTGRRESLIAPALRAFEAESGIRVQVKSGSTGALAQQILAERGNPQASVLISQDAPTCEVLRTQGALQANPDRALEVIPDAYRAPDGSWIGVSGRARVVMYNRNLVRRADLPQTVQDLANPRWRGRIAAPSTREASLVSWAGALVRQLGRERAQALLTQIARNTTTLPSHTDVRKAVGRGEFALGLVNHYYYHLESAEGSPVGLVYTDQARTVRVRVRVTGPNGRVRTVIRGRQVPAKPLGVLFNAASVCLVKGGPAQSEARALMAWMTSGRAQQLFAELNYEYPLRRGLPPTNGVKPLPAIDTAQVALRDIDPVAGLEVLEAAGFR
jgi:iron(III) transport system substrate-binding protein